MEKDEKKLKYNNQREYLNFISTFPKASIPQTFCFYTFSYFFHLNPDFRDMKIENKRYFSFQPMDLVLYVSHKKKYFVGINWNQMTVLARKLLLTKIKKDYPNSFEEGRIKVLGLNLRKLIRYLRKSKILIRKYLFSRVRVLRFIPAEKIDSLMNFYANFYYKTTYNWVANRYRNYRPKP